VSFRLVFRPEAEKEIAEAARWYEARGSGLAAEFLLSLDLAAASLASHPLQHPEIHPGMRRALPKRSPYSLVYSVAADEAVVLGCVHWRLHPRRWRDRE